ncbi:MAG: AAA family ATPase [Candidatus Firestonebacteria bacterium]
MSENHNKIQSDKCVAFVHHKGGTGKTTSCLNIAGWLVKMNKKVLVVDLDAQGNATAGLGLDRKTIDGSIYDVIFNKKNIKKIILETPSGVYLAPSSLDLLKAEMCLGDQEIRMDLLNKKIKRYRKIF